VVAPVEAVRVALGSALIDEEPLRLRLVVEVRAVAVGGARRRARERRCGHANQGSADRERDQPADQNG
jgi:hypothetical protein